MQQDLIMFLYGGAIVGWLMCCFHSYNWIKKDCGWEEEKTSTRRPIINDTDETTTVEAIIIDEL